jgi:hypothetical protein
MLPVILQALNSLQSLNFPRVTPGALAGAVLAACPGAGHSSLRQRP